MFEAFSFLLIWRNRRKTDEPVEFERRRMTPKRAQERVLESVSRLQASIDRHCQK